MQNGDVKRPGRIIRYKPVDPQSSLSLADDPIPEYMNVLGMVFSMCGLMMRMKWCAWVALLCSCVSFANARTNDDAKQIVSSFIFHGIEGDRFVKDLKKQTLLCLADMFTLRLSISAVVMSYLQNPQPIMPPWANLL